MKTELALKTTVKNFFFTPLKVGGLSANSLKYWLVLLCYLLSALILIRDPFFYNDGFVVSQSLFVSFIAIYVVGIFCWDILFFGAPKGANLILQFAMLLPVFFLSARFFGEIAYTNKSFFEELADTGISYISNYFVPIHIPNFIKDMFANPASLIALIAILFATCFKQNEVKFAIIVIVFLFGLFDAISHSSTTCKYLMFSIIPFLIALFFHFSRYDKEITKVEILKRILNKNIDTLELKVCVEIAFKVAAEGKITNKEIESIFAENYSSIDSGKDIKLCTMKLLEKLIVHRKILNAKFDANGVTYELNSALSQYSSTPKSILRVIQIAFMVLLTIIWLLLPIDLIPDAVPFLGVLDDSFVLLVTTFSLKNSTSDITQNKN